MPRPAPTLPTASLLCGVDEAGRGPLAGSVFAAAVVLDPARPIRGLADSKQLAEAVRERLPKPIRSRSLPWAVPSASAEGNETPHNLPARPLALPRPPGARRLGPRENS